MTDDRPPWASDRPRWWAFGPTGGPRYPWSPTPRRRAFRALFGLGGLLVLAGAVALLFVVAAGVTAATGGVVVLAVGVPAAVAVVAGGLALQALVRQRWPVGRHSRPARSLRDRVLRAATSRRRGSWHR